MTVIFSSETPSSLTISLLEHCDDVITARENFAQLLNTIRCMAVIRLECVGMASGVTSWIVANTGTLLMGRVAAVGIKNTSACACLADKPAPPIRQSRS